MNSRLLITFLVVLGLAQGVFAEGTKEQPQPTFQKVEVRGGNNAAPLPPLAPSATLPDDQARFDSYVKSVDWLVANKDSVIVLDARTKAEYDKGHIPGAVQAHWTDWSNVSVPQGTAGWSVILPPDQLAQKLAKLGIDGSKPVVIYNDPLTGWGEEGRQLWALRVFGLTNSFILNGGLAAWRRSGGTVTVEVPVVKEGAVPKANPNQALFASTEFVSGNLQKVKLLDVREPEEFNGDKVYGEKDKGRIPGARHAWFKDFYNLDGTLQSPAQLRSRFASLGFQLSDAIVAYCTGGIRSGFSTIALKIAGYSDVRNYDASFSEWTGTGQVVER